MTTITFEEMRKLLVRGVEIRNKYFYDESDPVSELNEGATESDISKLETILEHRLPPTFRLFLKISNGWNFVDAHISLMSVVDIGNSYKTKEIEKWYAEIGGHDSDYSKNIVAIGDSDITEAKYVLILPDQSNKSFESHTEEWPVMYISESSDHIYENFLDFLKKSQKMYKELVEGEEL